MQKEWKTWGVLRCLDKHLSRQRVYTLRHRTGEEPDQRWDAVSNEVRPLKRQTFHDEVHGVLSQATADGLTSSWIHLSPSQSVATPKGRTTSTDESPWFCLNSVLAEANASAINLLRRA